MTAFEAVDVVPGPAATVTHNRERPGGSGARSAYPPRDRSRPRTAVVVLPWRTCSTTEVPGAAGFTVPRTRTPPSRRVRSAVTVGLTRAGAHDDSDQP